MNSLQTIIASAPASVASATPVWAKDLAGEILEDGVKLRVLANAVDLSMLSQPVIRALVHEVNARMSAYPDAERKNWDKLAAELMGDTPVEAEAEVETSPRHIVQLLLDSPDPVLAVHLYRTLANKLLFSTLNLQLRDDEAFTFAIERNQLLYGRCYEQIFVATNFMPGQYDLPMTPKDALLFMKQQRTMDEEVLQELSRMANVNAKTLRLMETESHREQVGRIKRMWKAIVASWPAEFTVSDNPQPLLKEQPDEVVHYMGCLAIRSAVKIRANLLKRIIRYQNMSEVGLFSYLDALVESLVEPLGDMEFDLDGEENNLSVVTCHNEYRAASGVQE